MKLFIQIVTIIAVSLLVSFSQAHASDSYCMEEVRRCQDPPRCRHWKTETVPKNTQECREFRRKLREALGMPPSWEDQLVDKPKDLRKEFGIPSMEVAPVDEPKDTKSIKPTETPNLK